MIGRDGRPQQKNLVQILREWIDFRYLTEDVRYGKSGALLTRDMMTYKIPGRQDVPRIRVELTESHDPSGPFGAKSVGEIGIDTPPAVIANAVFNATGVRIRDLPLTPEKVLMALHQARESE